MENEIINLSDLICNSLNSIFFQIFSSIDNKILSNLDNILFINSNIIDNIKFKNIFGNSSTGILLIANSLILGIVIYYVLNFALSHLLYFHIDSPFQFIFKSIIFISCMNSSFWICEQIINFIYILSSSICELSNTVFNTQCNFENLLIQGNNIFYSSIETFNLFSLNGILMIFSQILIISILISYSIRYIICQILVILSPFAFLSLINNHTDGFFKGWLKQFLSLLIIQIFLSIILVLSFSLELNSENILSKIMYISILFITLKSNLYIKDSFSFIYNHSKNSLKNYI